MRSAKEPYSTSSSRVTLSVLPPRHGAAFAPHTPLEVLVRYTGKQATGSTPPTVRLVGTAQGLAPARQMWAPRGREQVDRQALSSFAPSGGNCHVFCDAPLSLLPHSPRSEGSEGSVLEGAEQRLNFGGMVPELEEGLILPSFELDGPGGERWAHIAVKWCIKLRGARKGLFKSDDKLSLCIPVEIPFKPAVPLKVPAELWPRREETSQLTYKDGGGAHPRLAATLAYHPLSYAGQSLLYRLAFSFPTSPLSTSLLTTAPSITAFISRRPKTSLGGDDRWFCWPVMRLVEGEPDQVDEEGLVFEGELDVPEGERSVMGLTVAVEYVLGVTVNSRALSAPLVIKMPIVLPSTSTPPSPASPSADLGSKSSSAERTPPPYSL